MNSTQASRPAVSGRLGTIAALVMAGAVFTGCTTTSPTDSASPGMTRESVNAQSDAALTRLYNSVPGARELVSGARGVLVCPQVISGALGVGAEYGRCVLREANGTSTMYRTTALSVGFQAGAQSRAMYYVFNTQDSIDRFKASNGWTAGVDATVAVASMGANASVDTNTMKQPIVGFVMTNAGLEAGAAVQGSKFTRVDN